MRAGRRGDQVAVAARGHVDNKVFGTSVCFV